MPPAKVPYVLGKLDCQLIRYPIMALSTKAVPDTSAETVAARWFVEVTGISRSNPPCPNPWAAALATSGPSSSAGDARSLPNLMQFDAEGSPISAPKTVLAAQGVVIGLKARAVDDGRTYLIESITDNGIVGLKLIGIDGSMGPAMLAGFTEFTSTYTIVANEAPPALFDWPVVDVMVCPAYEQEIHRCRLSIAMSDFYDSCEHPTLTIKDTPQRGVFVGGKHGVGKLVLPLAATKTVVLDDQVQTSKPRFPTYARAGGGPTGYHYCFVGPGFKGFFAAAWACQTKSEEEECNAKIALKASKTPGWKVPVVTNTKPLKPGEEIIVFKQAVQKPSPKARSILKRSFDCAPPSTTGPNGRPRRLH